MKYFKINADVFAFEADGSQDDYIEPDMEPMTAAEVDKHVNPEKYLTDAEKADALRATLRPLTRRQFKLVLLEAGLLPKVEAAIQGVTDEALRARLGIEYADATEFVRTSESVGYMVQLLGMSADDADKMWARGLEL